MNKARKMNDKGVIIVSKCKDCPYNEYNWKTSSKYCSKLGNNDKIIDIENKLINCPLELLDPEKIKEDLNAEKKLLEKIINRFSDKINISESIDDWAILKSPLIFDIITMNDREELLLKELLCIIEVHIFNDGDKETISKKIIEILKKTNDKEFDD